MNIHICSANVKIFEEKDCLVIDRGECFENESFCFQVFIQSNEDISAPIDIQSDLPVNCYLVKKLTGGSYRQKEIDDYYCFAPDDKYPDLLTRTNKLDIKKDESVTLFFEVSSKLKKAGEHIIKIKISDQEISIPLVVLPAQLEESDLMITHWLHEDCICNYYKVQPFSCEFYEYFRKFLAAYVKMGNTMLLVPVFTPALDTEVGGERLTTQLLEIEKIDGHYIFNFQKMDEFIDVCQECGIKYFELAHLYTQWGGEFCPKIIVKVNGNDEKLFGWHTESESEAYQQFLKEYFVALTKYLNAKGIYENTYIHLTDEPNAAHIQKYLSLSKFVKEQSRLKTIDAMSHYDIVKENAVDLPVVCTSSAEFEKFSQVDKLIYYCIDVDDNYLSNRYFHMPLQRTEIIGFQLYEVGAKGFLHWGFNFYNSQFSRRSLNPYEETTAGGAFCSGDSFIVYPGDEDVEYSLRYFSMLKAFEDYRLLKTLEKKIGRENTIELLHKEGVRGVHEYPHSASWHENFRTKLREKILE